MAKEYLAEWKADYPGEVTLDSPVFLNERRGPLTRAGDDGGSVIAIMLLGED
ncbi:MAG TPA: hypothetical protein PK445_10710 [Methanolinea sp.]|jgi:hypothetical protein|nr:hypothetical protein [Methanolinea sp.]HOS83183.1 hypothetical protein [Methanolinea sp.]